MKLHHFNPKREKRGLLFKVFVVVAIIQVSLLVALSSYIVSVTYFTEEKEFVPPPSTEKIEPKVKITKIAIQKKETEPHLILNKNYEETPQKSHKQEETEE